MGVGEAPVGGEGAGRLGALPAPLRLLRLHHWLKNGFVLAPVPFAVAAGSPLRPVALGAGLLGFCLLSSAIYALNDVRDAEADRRNPRKRHRPVASGEVSASTAWALCAALLVGAFALAAATGERSVALLFATYLGLNVAYSFGAKHVAVLDVFILASGFLIRVLVGCAVLDAEPSQWLLLCTSALALFMAFAKRRGDLVEGAGADQRPSLSGYDLAYLNAAIGLCAGVTLVAYALYSMEAPVMVPGRELVGLVFVAFAVLDYLRIIYTRNEGASPVGIALRYRSLQLAGLLWMLATAWSLGLF